MYSCLTFFTFFTILHYRVGDVNADTTAIAVISTGIVAQRFDGHIAIATVSVALRGTSWKQGLRCRLPRPPSQCLCPQRQLYLDLIT